MKPTLRLTAIYLSAAAIAAFSGFAIQKYLGDGAKPLQPAHASRLTGSGNELLGRDRPTFTLPDLDGKPVSISRWDGSVVLINFWATWCPPCRREIPEFQQVRDRYSGRGFEIVGVAIDNRDSVVEFLEEIGVRYPQLLGEREAIGISREYGNRYGALPYSVLVGRDGKVEFVRPGELSGETLDAEVVKLL
ncbi:MAG: TlpA disulfide reductase family protein [Pseudomonadota bacterium]|nr:TlpA disulfide reductase family protein [Pseudomonadota bacterium]